MVLPANVGYGTVVGKFIDTLGDPIKGTVTLTPSPDFMKDPGAAPPVTILPKPVTVTLDPDGAMPPTRVVATNDPDLNPSGWTYTVTYAFTGATLTGYSIEVPENATVDLTLVSPVASADGTFYIAGPPGRVQEVVAGTNVTVDSTDPARPVVSATGGGGGGAVVGGVIDHISADATIPNNGSWQDIPFPLYSVTLPAITAGDLLRLSCVFQLQTGANTGGYVFVMLDTTVLARFAMPAFQTDKWLQLEFEVLARTLTSQSVRGVMTQQFQYNTTGNDEAAWSVGGTTGTVDLSSGTHTLRLEVGIQSNTAGSHQFLLRHGVLTREGM